MTKDRILLHDIAGHLGMPVTVLENILSINELREWAEYFAIKPIHADRSERQLATLSAMFYNANFKDNKSQVDFMLSVSDEERRQQKENELQAKIKSFFRGR